MTPFPHDCLRRAWRAHLGRRGLDAGQVRFLRQATTGRRVKVMSNPQRVTAGALVNAGLLERTPSGGVEMSGDVRYSLLLEQQADWISAPQ